MSSRRAAVSRIGLIISLAAVAVAGCRTNADDPSSVAGEVSPPVPTVTITETATASPSTNVTDQARSVTQSQPATNQSTVTVPNGVGLNYQQAQDAWRGAGLHVSPATDASGAHRLPIIDSNWVVLSQNPPAGATVAVGSFIVATVKKYTDG
jgi:beta-lactam-binding protein with PASTA domain